MTEACPRPNIVFVLIDDLGWADLGCYGSTFYETPHLDRLAAAGARFTNAYAAAPVCSPTRASIMTGKYPARVGVTQWIGGHAVGRLRDVPYFHELPLDEYSLARALRDGGSYQTWHVGKWHLGERRTWPDRHGFDVNVAGCQLGHPPSYMSPYGIPAIEDGPPGEYLTDRLTDEAVALVENAGDQPFFLNLWHYAVHTPIQAPEQLVRKYEEKARALGLDQVDAIKTGEPMPTWHQRHEYVQRRVVQSDPGYAAMIENLDTNIGRLLDALDRTGKADNTIVIFTSDNGGLSSCAGSPTCNAPLAEGKGWMYDGGLRVPLLIRWPGVVDPNTTLPDVVTSPDFYPTLLEAAAVLPIPQAPYSRAGEADGHTFLPLLMSGQSQSRPIFWHYPHYGNQGGTPGAAVREGDWKLVRFFEDNHVELYNLAEDISETRDLAGTNPATAARLDATLEHWLREVEARIPAPNPVSAYDDLPG
ncbi:sulfatase [Actinopolymorpha rutila]|uniref:Arylsulfatase A-like enzyme n=1 Tax=Actinopolymorpha rutila TaxID=446787 RepID=A0A852ZRJ4_9ACTN|nr:sulfatase [Actinopolymorpha rutila]NYH91206.1 arylsulfatase A-like enzyme [Actinopolymorpha rutila]